MRITERIKVLIPNRIPVKNHEDELMIDAMVIGWMSAVDTKA